jgi:hypothetical protein
MDRVERHLQEALVDAPICALVDELHDSFVHSQLRPLLVQLWGNILRRC